jgi:hypothetical protein
MVIHLLILFSFLKNRKSEEETVIVSCNFLLKKPKKTLLRQPEQQLVWGPLLLQPQQRVLLISVDLTLI